MPLSPRVSVCIPTYRGAATLGAAIESVLAQTLTDFELVIIDDGSPDDTRAVVERYRDPRLRYLRNESNLGPEGNWNRCLAEAQGRFFKLLPHDDLLHPECLARQVIVLETDRDERLALVFSARTVLRPDGRALMRRGYPGAVEGRLPAQQVMRACVRRGTNLLGEPGAVLMRRSLAERVGPFDATFPYVIDLDYWFRLLLHGDAYYCAEPLASFRVSTGQWSIALGRQQSADFRRCVARHRDRSGLSIDPLDELIGWLTSEWNSLARRVFYRLYLT
jgi:glycosyltransferase involved in cell wall biosynthesis